MKDAPVTCIVLNWNGGGDALNCINSIHLSEGVCPTVIVVDNGSTDGSPGKLSAAYNDLLVIRNARNLGVAAAWNQAITKAKEIGFDPVFLLNTDATVNADGLKVLLHTLNTGQNVGIVTPRILNRSSGTVWFDGGVLNLWGATVHRNSRKSPRPDTAVFEEDFASGCAMLVNPELLKSIRFDETYFAYSEDADFSFHARQEGWRILHNPLALVIHDSSSSVKLNRGKWFRDYYVTRNSIALARRHSHGLRQLMFFCHFGVVEVFARIVWFALTGQPRRVSAVVQGVIDSMRGKYGKRYD